MPVAIDGAQAGGDCGDPPGGLVWAFAFDAGGSPLSLPDADVQERLASREGWLWLHFTLTDSRARDWIARCAPIGDAARDVLLGRDLTPRVLLQSGEVAGVVSDFHLEFDRRRTSDVGHLRIVMTERLIVSARSHQLRTVETVRSSLQQGRRIPDVGLFFEIIVDAFLDAALENLEAASDELDDVEEGVIAGHRSTHEARVGAIRRALLKLHREIIPLRAALRRIGAPNGESGTDARLQATVVSSAQRLSIRLETLDRDIYNLQERSRLIREEINALAAAETSRHLFVISVLSAIFLPGTLITGIFGMNTKDLPLQQTENGFWFAIGIVAVASALVLAVLRYRIVR